MNQEEIKALLLSNDRAVERAILAIYQRQTSDEQSSETTRHFNGAGFSAFDAKMGSYWARWLQSGRHLTGSHLARARQMSIRYIRQLEEVVQKRQAERATV